MAIVPWGPARNRELRRELEETRAALALKDSQLTRVEDLYRREITEAAAQPYRSRVPIAESRKSRAGGGSFASGVRFGKMKKGETFYRCYATNPWISGPIDTIASRMTSGGYDLRPITKGASAQHKQDILDLFLFFNDDENTVEACQLTVTELFIFAESYWEMTRGTRKNLPLGLFTIDPVTMEPKRDKQGVIESFNQTIPDGSPIKLDPSEIVYFRQRGPRGIVLSPIEKLLDSAVTYGHMVNWQMSFFENGAKAPYWVHLGPTSTADDIDPAVLQWEELYTGPKNAGRSPVVAGEMVIHEFTAGRQLEADFLASQKFLREAMFTVLGIPPGELVGDDGSRLGDTSVAADKRFRNNTITPKKRLFEETVTYRVIQQGFGYDDWAFELLEANYEDDALLVKLVIDQITAGLITRDEGRQRLGAEGKVPQGGGDVATITLSREVVPVNELTDPSFHSTQFLNAKTAQDGVLPAVGRTPGRANSALPPLTLGAEKPAVMADAHADLARWQRVALKTHRIGKAQRVFESDAIPSAIQQRVSEVLSMAESEDQVKRAFDVGFASLREDAEDVEETRVAQDQEDEAAALMRKAFALRFEQARGKRNA